MSWWVFFPLPDMAKEAKRSQGREEKPSVGCFLAWSNGIFRIALVNFFIPKYGLMVYNIVI